MIKVVRVLTYEFADEATALAQMGRSLPDGGRVWNGSSALRVKTICSEIPLSDDELRATMALDFAEAEDAHQCESDGAYSD